MMGQQSAACWPREAQRDFTDPAQKLNGSRHNDAMLPVDCYKILNQS